MHKKILITGFEPFGGQAIKKKKIQTHYFQTAEI